jgi:hypothetical protein
MEDIEKLAKDLLTQTPHSPVPMKTTARLAKAVLSLTEDVEHLRGKLRDANNRIEGVVS